MNRSFAVGIFCFSKPPPFYGTFIDKTPAAVAATNVSMSRFNLNFQGKSPSKLRKVPAHDFLEAALIEPTHGFTSMICRALNFPKQFLYLRGKGGRYVQFILQMLLAAGNQVFFRGFVHVFLFSIVIARILGLPITPNLVGKYMVPSTNTLPMEENPAIPCMKHQQKHGIFSF